VDHLAEYRRAELFFDSGDPAGAARLLEPIAAAEPMRPTEDYTEAVRRVSLRVAPKRP